MWGRGLRSADRGLPDSGDSGSLDDTEVRERSDRLLATLTTEGLAPSERSSKEVVRDAL